jgi:hypothetical protein
VFAINPAGIARRDGPAALPPSPRRPAVELVGGIAIGYTIPWLAIRLERTRWFAVSEQYLPLNAVAIDLRQASTPASTLTPP